MNVIQRFRSLPSNTKSTMSLALILALLVALPLFVYTLVTMNFNQNEKAASGEPVDIALGEPTIGIETAPVTIVMYSDFLCPFCKAFVDNTFSTILTNYPTQVKFVFKDFPITSVHPLAEKAAIAGQCAFAQDKFWEMHDLIFAKQDTLIEADFTVFATQLSLNLTQFNTCYTNQTPLAEVNDDYQEGLGRNVTGTPTFFVNDQMLIGAQPFSEFQRVINEELGLTGSATATATATATGSSVPTPTASPTDLPVGGGEANSCGGTCGSNYNCKANLYCYQGYCRNPICSTDTDCDCTSATASPTPKATIKAGATIKATTTAKGSAKATPTYTSGITNYLNNDDSEGSETQTEAKAPENMFWAKYAIYIFGLFVIVVISTIYYAVKKNKEPKDDMPRIVPPTNI